MSGLLWEVKHVLWENNKIYFECFMFEDVYRIRYRSPGRLTGRTIGKKLLEIKESENCLNSGATSKLKGFGKWVSISVMHQNHLGNF